MFGSTFLGRIAGYVGAGVAPPAPPAGFEDANFEALYRQAKNEALQEIHAGLLEQNLRMYIHARHYREVMAEFEAGTGGLPFVRQRTAPGEVPGRVVLHASPGSGRGDGRVSFAHRRAPRTSTHLAAARRAG